jgi:hypothetical protein
MLLVASCDVDCKDVDPTSELPPPWVRENCEDAIEHVAGFLSLANQAAVKILNPNVAVAWNCDPDLGCAHASKKGAVFSGDQRVNVRLQLDCSPEFMVQFNDRAQSVYMVAEALAATDSSSRFKSCIRVFESAFRSQFEVGISKKLARVLEGGPVPVTRQDIEGWAKLRGGLVHADLKKAKAHLFSRDVGHVVERLEAAAIDVLMHKKEWGSGDTARRSLVGRMRGSDVDQGPWNVNNPCLMFSLAIWDPWGVWRRDVDHSWGIEVHGVPPPPADSWMNYSIAIDADKDSPWYSGADVRSDKKL